MLRDAGPRMIRAMFRRLQAGRDESKILKALDDVSFEVRAGERRVDE
jgi:ABC-type oligopeptide transport system ATPase subunit